MISFVKSISTVLTAVVSPHIHRAINSDYPLQGRKMKKMILVNLTLMLAIQASALSAIRLVPDEYPSIQAAINDCIDGDIIIVEPGSYYETINFSGKNIILTGTDPNDPQVVAGTIIDAEGDGSTVIFENGETAEAVLRGFTITGGYGTRNDEFGGGILWGGGIYCAEASPTITDNVIADKFENAMKKGFIHSIILSLLNRGPCHGYQIKREILDSNLGYWNLQDSTLYTVLKQLTDKGLIEYVEESEGERKKKVYHLTKKGEDIYEIITKRQNRIYKSTFSLLSLILQEEESEFTDLVHVMKLFSPISSDPKFMKSKSIPERILILQEVKENIRKRIEGFQNMVQNLDTKINLLKNTKNKE